MVPVLFAFIGFAVDLGRLYLVRGELQTAADTMALAAASKLNGTDGSLSQATEQAAMTIEAANELRNRFNFGANTVGQSDGFSTSGVETQFFATKAAATSMGFEAADAGGVTARHTRISLQADAPLLFFGFLNTGQRRTPVRVSAVAGMSAPLCNACAIEPIAIAAPDQGDDINFGFLPNTKYTLGYACNGGMQPGPLVAGGPRIEYLLLNRYDASATLFASEITQAYRIGAQGLAPSANSEAFCMRVGADETLWVNAAPTSCMLAPPPALATAFACGIASRFDNTVPAVCNAVPEAETLAALYQPDTDLNDIDDFSAYSGSGRRVITAPIVDSLAGSGPMRVLGFRQFLVEPNPDSLSTNASDPNARFVVIYIGSSVPLKQGTFEGCTQTAGPGKIVLHR